MASIIVLGAAGQLGQAICQKLSEQQLTYVAYNRSQLDITQAQQLQQLFLTQKPAIVINCAAYTAVDLAETEQQRCSAINEHAVTNLARLCKQYGTLLIHFSTDYVFDGRKTTPYTEQDLPNPINHYGKSKLAGEQAIQQSQCKHYIIRTSWLYSEWGKNFYTTMRRLAQQKAAARVVHDQIGAPTHANNLAAITVSILKHYHSRYSLPVGLYHYCDNTYMSWYQFAQQIYKEHHCLAEITPISSQEYNALANRPANSRLSCLVILNWSKGVMNLKKEKSITLTP